MPCKDITIEEAKLRFQKKWARLNIPNFKIVEFEGDKDPDQRNYIVQNSKIENKGFKASISIERGIEELLKSFEILNPSMYTNL